MATAPELLRRLARLHGIQTAYYDNQGRSHAATDEALRRIVEAFGTPIGDGSTRELADAVIHRTHALVGEVLSPVTTAWGGRATMLVKLPERDWPVRLRVSLLTEVDPLDRTARIAETETFTVDVADLPIAKSRDVDGCRYVSRVVELPTALPLGYHAASVEVATETHETLLLSAPEKAYQRPRADPRWGVFAPLYSVQTDRSWGAGDLTDLQSMMHWLSEQGGDMVATLPLLPPQSENSDDPSPYSAGSRLMWNDLYLDLTACGGGRFASDAELAALREKPSVDYDTLRPLRRRVMQSLADAAFADRPSQFESVDATTLRYARFQAECERTGATWFEWPDGHDPAGDASDPLVRRHLWAQTKLREQLDEVGRTVAELGQTWYLDYPLGVNAAGFDVWAYRSQFVLGASGGAPPDVFFTKGQNWGFPPMHPDGLRRDGYAYFIRTLRHHLRYAKLLRFDHVMGLYRLFWVPHGFDARDGAYVRYRMDELLAVLCIESALAEAELVGENLGTVPPAIDAALPRHGIGGMTVTQFSVDPEGVPPVAEPPADDIASVNTHDMPTFAAFVSGHDVADRVDLGLMTEDEAKDEIADRRVTVATLRAYLAGRGLLASDGDLLAAVYRQLGRSEAPVVLASLDDLVDELTPQNTPGTFKERPNWSRKLAKSLDELTGDERAMSRLKTLAAAREPDQSRGRET